MRYLFILWIIITFSCENQNNQTINKNLIDSTSVRTYPVISDSTNILEQKVRILELQYTVWGCACPNWITHSDAIKYQDSGFLKHHVYIEPADSTLYYPDSLFDFATEKIKVTGNFYIKEDYPQGTRKFEEPLPKAKVFRYTKIEVLKK